MIRYIAVAACSPEGVIGGGNQLLWHQKADMIFFKKITANQAVLMGYNTYESLPENYKPLKGRLNLVLTSKKIESKWDNLHFFSDIESMETWALTNKINTIYLIGGALLYRSLLPKCIMLYLTKIYIDELTLKKADAFFPLDFKYTHKFQTERFLSNDDNDFDYSFEHYILNPE
ncbi:MAG: dihydrofolate reductase [Chitinophagales bacterium]|nr:dihydrofolate reductase [Chitinophagales bacterium]